MISNALLQFRLKKEHCKPHEATRHPTKCVVINDIKLFLTVYQRIYCCRYLTLSKQMSRYKIKYIRILYYPLGFFFYIKQFIATCHLPDEMCRI